MMFDGPASADIFTENGREYLQLYRDLLDLQPTARMLDIGCGIGRKTIPLVPYLTQGSYEGIDCNISGIDWCQENITPVAPNFRFQHVDIYARNYNPYGIIPPETFNFPFPDAEFDVITLNSVFTHMASPGVEQYLREVSRMLKPTGQCFITWFITDGDRWPHPGFPDPHDHGWMANWASPEQAITYDLEWVFVQYHQANLNPRSRHLGRWSGRSHGLTHQDIIIGAKA
jgi:SAM-dependent methyltransferase